ncbi:Glutamate carboxypeptidase Tre2, partial [Rasamsonia emersonii CBS 393.64]
GPKRQSEQSVNLKPLYDAAGVFRENAARFHAWDQVWYSAVYGSGGFESNVMGIKRTSHNTRMANFETRLLDLAEDGGVSIAFSDLSVTSSAAI